MQVDYFRLIFADPESQAALEDVSDLLIFMRMLRHNSALLQVNMRQHNAVACYQPTIQHVGYLLFRHVFPAIKRHSSLVHCRLQVSSLGSDDLGCHGLEPWRLTFVATKRVGIDLGCHGLEPWRST